ncbi:MAG: sulfite exporter TauE/SafE family protein [bacterium]|nr:sulfite exporter TauE/SafE family protein [bacterium]
MIQHLQTLLLSGSQGGLLMPLLVTFLGGVFTSFTPCIFPMIPITFSIITATKESKRHPILSVLLFGFGLSLAYVALGAIAVASGGIFGSFLQYPWIKIAVANVFFLLAFNSVGWLTLPQKHIQKAKINSPFSLIIFGALTGLTMSPCTLPILAIILAYAATQSLINGMLLLWVYAWGFFAILLLIAFFGESAKTKLPKSGNWLSVTKWAMFALCFAVGQWFLMQAGGL